MNFFSFFNYLNREVFTQDASYLPDTNKLDVSHNPKLHTIKCSYNKLTKIDVTHQPDLVELSCRKNMIKKLNLSKNSKLSTLDCRENALTTLDLRHNTLVNYLMFDEDQVKLLGNNPMK